MKKFIAGLSALTLAGLMTVNAFAMAVPVPAENNNTVTQTDSLPAERGTDVTYQVNPEYTVTIPASVTLTDSDVTDTIKVEGKEANTTPRLASGQKVVVTLTAAENGFDGTTLTIKADDIAKANYTVKGKNGAAGKDDVVAEFEYAPTKTADDYIQTVTFTAPTNVQYAGTYTDKLTFTVAVE